MGRIKALGFLLLIVLAVPLAWNAMSYFNFDPNYGFLRLKKHAIETGWYLPGYYAHVLVAGIVLVIGIYLIHPTWGRRLPALHRFLGKVYIGGILFCAAPGGLIMSFFIDRGMVVLMSFLLQSGAWIFCTYRAYHFAHSRNFALHRQWVLRSYSLTLAAITLRLYAFLSSWSFDLNNPVAYATIAWLSWVPNLVICEWYIRNSVYPNIQKTAV